MENSPVVGDLYLIPLASGGFARALLTHTWEDEPNSAFFWFFGPRLGSKELDRAKTISDQYLVERTEHTLHEIRTGEWKHLGRILNVTLQDYPMPLKRFAVNHPEVAVLHHRKLYERWFEDCPPGIDPWKLPVWAVLGPGAGAALLNSVLPMDGTMNGVESALRAKEAVSDTPAPPRLLDAGRLMDSDQFNEIIRTSHHDLNELLSNLKMLKPSQIKEWWRRLNKLVNLLEVDGIRKQAATGKKDVTEQEFLKFRAWLIFHGLVEARDPLRFQQNVSTSRDEDQAYELWDFQGFLNVAGKALREKSGEWLITTYAGFGKR